LEKKTRPLKSGESLGEWQAFFFEIPDEITDLKVVFGDVAPLSISIR
jgi:hypothetical protein